MTFQKSPVNWHRELGQAGQRNSGKKEKPGGVDRAAMLRLIRAALWCVLDVILCRLRHRE